MLKEGFLMQNTKLKKWSLSKYVIGKPKFISKEIKKEIIANNDEQIKSGKKSRNVFTIPKYKTNDHKNTALSRFTNDAKLQK